jgi:hypothetical protein
MRSTVGQAAAVLLAATIGVPAMAQSITTNRNPPFVPLAQPAPPVSLGTLRNTAIPGATTGAGAPSPFGSVSTPSGPAASVSAPTGPATSTTSSSISTTTVFTPAPFGSASTTAISAYVGPAGDAPTTADGYSSVAIPNPAAGTLQATTGTIETGAASSLPVAGTGAPLNMAPAGVALNSDLSATRAVAVVPVAVTTTAMGAGPAAYAQPAPAAPAPLSAHKAPPSGSSMRPPRADRS